LRRFFMAVAGVPGMLSIGLICRVRTKFALVVSAAETLARARRACAKLRVHTCNYRSRRPRNLSVPPLACLRPDGLTGGTSTEMRRKSSRTPSELENEHATNTPKIKLKLEEKKTGHSRGDLERFEAI